MNCFVELIEFEAHVVYVSHRLFDLIITDRSSIPFHFILHPNNLSFIHGSVLLKLTQWGAFKSISCPLLSSLFFFPYLFAILQHTEENT